MRRRTKRHAARRGSYAELCGSRRWAATSGRRANSRRATDVLNFDFLHLSEPWYIYVSMPIIAATIGYLTKLVAIEMIFRPKEFVGIKPFLGWQGMVPRRAAKMAAIAVDSVMSKILQPEELFDRIDPDDLIKEVEGP